MNDKVYIHEFINIIGQGRARYMHHMTANWSPIAQEERHQLCYGVWGTIGSTGRWPEVVNMWEEDGWEGLARSFGHETGHPDLQDPKLRKWWATAAEVRSGGVDRIVVPTPWSPTIEELTAAGTTGMVYAHDLVTVEPGTISEYLEVAHEEGSSFYQSFGWNLVGAFETALGDDREGIVIWAIPTWNSWAEAQAKLREPAGAKWRDRNIEATTAYNRILLVDAPLSPLRIGRQPARDDRTGDWEES